MSKYTTSSVGVGQEFAEKAAAHSKKQANTSTTSSSARQKPRVKCLVTWTAIPDALLRDTELSLTVRMVGTILWNLCKHSEGGLMLTYADLANVLSEKRTFTNKETKTTSRRLAYPSERSIRRWLHLLREAQWISWKVSFDGCVFVEAYPDDVLQTDPRTRGQFSSQVDHAEADQGEWAPEFRDDAAANLRFQSSWDLLAGTAGSFFMPEPMTAESDSTPKHKASTTPSRTGESAPVIAESAQMIAESDPLTAESDPSSYRRDHDRKRSPTKSEIGDGDGGSAASGGAESNPTAAEHLLKAYGFNTTTAHNQRHRDSAQLQALLQAKLDGVYTKEQRDRIIGTLVNAWKRGEHPEREYTELLQQSSAPLMPEREQPDRLQDDLDELTRPTWATYTALWEGVCDQVGMMVSLKEQRLLEQIRITKVITQEGHTHVVLGVPTVLVKNDVERSLLFIIRPAFEDWIAGDILVTVLLENR